MINVAWTSRETLTQVRLYDDRFVGVARADHPILDEAPSPSMTAFLNAQHLLVSPLGGPGSVVDQCLAELGLERSVAMIVQSFSAAGRVLAETDMIAVLPERIAARAIRADRLSLFEAPLALPGFTMHALWHPRFDDDPKHRWFRSLVRRVGVK